MAKATAKPAPRGTKNLAKAFYSAASEIPETERLGAMKAALAQIRDDMAVSKAKAMVAKAKAQEKTTAAASREQRVPDTTKANSPVRAATKRKLAAKPAAKRMRKETPGRKHQAKRTPPPAPAPAGNGATAEG